MKKYIYLTALVVFMAKRALSIDVSPTSILNSANWSGEDLEQLISDENFHDNLSILTCYFKNNILDDISHFGLDRENPLEILALVAVLKANAAQMYHQSMMVINELGLSSSIPKETFSLFHDAHQAFDSKEIFQKDYSILGITIPINQNQISLVAISIKESLKKLEQIPESASKLLVLSSLAALAEAKSAQRRVFQTEFQGSLKQLSLLNLSPDKAAQMLERIPDAIFEKNPKYKNNLVLQSMKDILFPTYSGIKNGASVE